MKRNKLSLGILVCILAFGLMLVGPSITFAGPIFSATATHTSQTASFYLATYNPQNVTVYTEYTLNTDLFGALDAFCVDEADTGTGLYELFPPTSPDLDHAAWIADQYWENSSWGYTKEETQMAIWETVFDTDNNILAGAFRATGGVDTTNVQNILGLSYSTGLIGYVSLAHSPAGGDTDDLQDFLVNQPVPEPATMLLLGMGLVGLAGFGRKKFFKK